MRIGTRMTQIVRMSADFFKSALIRTIRVPIYPKTKKMLTFDASFEKYIYKHTFQILR